MIKTALYTTIFSSLFLIGCSETHEHSDELHNDHTHNEATEADEQDHEHKQENKAELAEPQDIETPAPDGDHDHQDSGHETGTIRQTDSHVHGDAMLAMALDGKVLTIELETPLYNLLGFERSPQTETEKKALQFAEATLSEPGQLFLFPSEAECRPLVQNTEVHLIASESHDGHKHDEDDHSEADHQDVLLEYQFNCDKPEALSDISTSLFVHFENIGELDTVYLGPSKQLQSTLRPGKTTLMISK